jgi:acetoacetyl-CoA synthetase
VFTAANFVYSGTWTQVVDESTPISSVPRWFEGVTLNFAENMMFSGAGSDEYSIAGRSIAGKEDGKIAVTEIREGRTSVRDCSYGDLRFRAARLAGAMIASGVKKGDRVVIVGSNSIETLLVFLATTWLGAIFSSSSTDIGVKGILQRTVQVDPKVRNPPRHFQGHGTNYYRTSYSSMMIPLCTMARLLICETG